MSLVEKQSSDCWPPEQPLCPPYIPGSFPPLTKSKSAGKNTEYSRETLVALLRSTVGIQSVSVLDKDGGRPGNCEAAYEVKCTVRRPRPALSCWRG